MTLEEAERVAIVCSNAYYGDPEVIEPMVEDLQEQFPDFVWEFVGFRIDAERMEAHIKVTLKDDTFEGMHINHFDFQSEPREQLPGEIDIFKMALDEMEKKVDEEP